MDNPRRAAAAALIKQEKNGYANLVLQHALQSFDGTPRDKAFFSAVFYGTVERQITLDYLLAQCIAKPLHKLDPEVRAILRSGLYQAKYMNVPVAAAISEAVKLTRRMGKTSAAGMVNAVLRKAVQIEEKKMVFSDNAERLCVQYSVSRPIALLLQESLGADCETFLAASFCQPTLCVRVNTMLTTWENLAQAFAAQGVETACGTIPNSLYIHYKGDITATELFRKGLFHVQGEASQFACQALCPTPGETVLDLCAAPGGKSVTLAQYMKNKGALYSGDVAQNRLALIEMALKRAGITCAQVLHNDASVYNSALPAADAVLCDVPCSGLGILAKKPDIRHKDLQGLKLLMELQREILVCGASYVKKGGRLVYSTCTVNPHENQEVVKFFLAGHPEFKLAQLPNAPEGAVCSQGMAFLSPPKTRTDGFFVASLERL